MLCCCLGVAVALAEDGVQPSAALGTLATGSAQIEMALLSATGVSRLKPATEGKWELAPGAYLTRAIVLRATEKTEQEEISWALPCGRKFGKLKSLTVTGGEVLSVPAGAPLVAKANVQRSERLVRINAAIIGRAGEEYEVAARRNGKRLAAPKLTIIDEAGSLLASGQLEYG